MTPANANAERPPLHMVPGHSAGEKRKAQLAVSRHPRPRPALAGFLRAAGDAKRFAAVAVAIDSVLKMIDEGTKDGASPCSKDPPMVTRDSIAPERSVKFTSPVEHVKDETFQARGFAAVEPTFAVGLAVEGVCEVGRGGFR